MLLCATCQKLTAQAWNVYPYNEPGTLLNFPADEGAHPIENTEWWYTVAHVTGDSTGNEYSFMLTYFAYDTVILTIPFDGFRIFNLANETTGDFFPETLPANYTTLSETHLEINASVVGGGPESWVTKMDSASNLIPFEYHLEAVSAFGAISLDYLATKRPLIVGDSGFFYQGSNDYTYYYSQTALDVSGSISIDGITESVTGLSWIDRQWGNFNPSSGEKYEWFCLQLDNGMDLNVWNIFNQNDQVPDTSTYTLCSIYHNDSTSSSNSEFNLERLSYSFMPDSLACYSQQWRFTYNDIDLLMTTLYDNREVQLPFRFYEGSMDITGTVGGIPVTGVGFAELLHTYVNPDLQLDNPVDDDIENSPFVISWTVLDSDEGRPVYFDLAYSIDAKATYTDIVTGLDSMSYYWDFNSLEGLCWLRLTGYSIDSTLMTVLEMDSSFLVGLIPGVGSELSSGLDVRLTPNPFSEQIMIDVGGSASERVSLGIYNSVGQLVKMLSSTAAGHYLWNGTDEEGKSIPDGLYYYQVKTSTGVANGKIMHLK